jgi:hypothetical protein
MEEAERLYHAERRRLPEALVSRRRKGLTLEDAYRVQWCGAALRVREGARVLGHKVGLTSKILMPLAVRSRVVEAGGASPADVVLPWCGLSPCQRLTLEPAPVGYSGLPPCRARVSDS